MATRMDDRDTTHLFGLPPLPVAVIGIMLATAMLATYHCIVAHWCSPRENTSTTSQRWLVNNPGSETNSDNSITELIPSCQYTKDIGLADVSCVVCLCELKDGDTIRVLPNCLHSFHVSCIDMWLHSHSNCPLCRTAAIPSRHWRSHRPEYHAIRLPDSG